jgi:hypothetical protein
MIVYKEPDDDTIMHRQITLAPRKQMSPLPAISESMRSQLEHLCPSQWVKNQHGCVQFSRFLTFSLSVCFLSRDTGLQCVFAL